MMHLPKYMIRKGSKVRLVRDSAGDLPKSLIGRVGKVIRRSDILDGIQLWTVKFPGRVSTLDLWRDELRKV